MLRLARNTAEYFVDEIVGIGSVRETACSEFREERIWSLGG